MFLPINGLINKGVTWIGGLRANGGGGELCRNVSNFNGTSSYAQFTNDIVLTSDFEIELYVKSSNISGDKTEIYLGNLSTTVPAINYESNGSIRIRTDSSSALQNSVSPILGELCVFKRVSGVGDILVAGVSVANGALTGNLTLNSIARYANSSFFFFEGQLRDLKIWDGGDRDTGTLLVDLPMDERYLNVHGEILYNNRAIKDAWYLRNFGNVSVGVNFQDIVIQSGDDFEILYKFNIDILSSFHFISDVSSDLGRIYYSSGTSEIKIQASTGTVEFLGTELGVDVDYIMYIKRVSGVLTLDLNGLIVTPAGTDVKTYTFNNLLARWGGGGGIGSLDGSVNEVVLWEGGDRTTGTKVLDYNFQSLSNVIVNQADTPSANLWDGSTATATGESSVIDAETINVLSTGVNSQVSVAETVAGQDVLVQVTVESGSLDNIICGDTTTEFTGWVNILDSFNQPIPDRFQTLTNNDTDFIVFKTNGVADVTLTGITAQTVEGYGVLNGTRNTNYEYKNDSPHAIGYNITVTKECEGDASAWNDPEGFNDPEEWND